MNARKPVLILTHTLFAILCTLVGAFVLNGINGGMYFGMYPLIPAFFYIVGLACALLQEYLMVRYSQKAMSVSLVIKAAKMLLSLIFMIVCCLVDRRHAVLFLLVFVVFYLVYVIFETLSLYIRVRSKKTSHEGNPA